MWDDRYSTSDYIYGTEPNHFLVASRDELPQSGRVLCVADGEGRNGVWLARQGFDVHSVDFSPNALAKAQKLAAEHGVSITTELADLSNWDWPHAAYEAVVGIFIQPFGPEARQTLFANIANALKPGGVFLLEGYSVDHLGLGKGGPGVAENLYTEEQLRAELTDFDIRSITAYQREMHEGKTHKGMSALIDVVAVKP